MFVVCWLVFFLPKDLNKAKGRITEVYKAKEIEMEKTEDTEKKEEVIPINNSVEEKITPANNSEDINDTSANSPITTPANSEKNNAVSI